MNSYTKQSASRTDGLESLPTEVVVDCILCPEASNAIDGRATRLLGLVSPYKVRRCDACGLRWLSPRPTETGYKEVYSSKNYFEGPAAPESFAALETVRHDYFVNRIELLERALPDGSKLHILDIGAALGQFVHIAQRRGHSATGFEFSKDARDEARERYGVDLRGGRLEDLVGEQQRYDAVHLNHVLEHLPEPRLSLRLIRQLLAPGGLLVLEVPQQFDNDLDRLRVLLSRTRPAAFNSYSLHHTYFFSPKTLRLLMEREDFKVLSLRTASWARTPLRPFSLKNAFLGLFLMCSDGVHGGGNIIEVFARR